MQTSVLWLWVALTAGPTAPMQNLETIAASAEQFLLELAADEHQGAEVGVKVNSPDPRLRLRACEQPLEPFVSPGNRMGRTVSVGISCAAPKPWKIYLRAQVSVIKETVVANRAIARGEILTQADLSIATIDSAAMGDPAFATIDDVVGMEATRAITAGRAVRSGQVRLPQVVVRGDAIVLVAGTDLFEVRMAGKALSSGAIGDLVNVESSGRQRAMQGRVVGPGLVRMR